ncbi:MAG: prepilin-type N-terminal cleavage/methylation domain-containing protein [Azoarcus sp.]|jgi:MSHA pilin protein MshC|nr:prepilin-type N-terminal cleavage/methylation domain-containing protein [Azoarcus sp.]
MKPARQPQSCAGFTLLELTVVILLLGILLAAAVPKMMDTSTFEQMVFRDELAASLRHAQKTAVSHRRLVCINVEMRRASTFISPSRETGDCTTPLPGPDGRPSILAASSATGVTPTGMIYFQPNGDITQNADGANPWNTALTVTGAPPIQIAGATGYVQ